MLLHLLLEIEPNRAFEETGVSQQRAMPDLGDATWERSRGWALSQAVIALTYYLHTNPPTVAHARHAIAGVLQAR